MAKVSRPEADPAGTELPPTKPVAATGGSLVDRLRAWTPALAPESLILLSALAFSLAYNNALWSRLFSDRSMAAPGNLLLAASLIVAVTAIQFSGLALVLPRRLVKPILAVLFLCTAVASFYMNRYAVFINKEMLRNVFATDVAESRELLTPDLVLYLLVFAALPIALLSRVRLTIRPFRRALAIRLVAIVAALLVAVAALLAQPREVSSILRNHRDARFLVTPTNYLVSLYRLARVGIMGTPGPRKPIALDARRLPAAVPGRPPVLLVLVVGEAVRSANFGLSGYVRDTTPELRGLDLHVFPRTRACGTSTEVSVPCLFAPVGRRDYNEGRIRGEESLLHVLQRVGFNVVWIDNQSGCKGVCAGLSEEHLDGKADPEFCDGERCLDDILLPKLAAEEARQPGDLVVVLHMLGNHGPAYFRRYPPAFRRFTPDCQSLQLDDCSPAEIVNAYDNAVLYSDHVLAGLIQYLQALPGRDTGLIYVADHGESLGEGGVYLHGLPYAIAPAVQTEVPMLMWLSPGLTASAGVDLACLKRRTREPASHDQFFHSVLGLLRVDTKARDADLDLFAPCAPLSNTAG